MIGNIISTKHLTVHISILCRRRREKNVVSHNVSVDLITTGCPWKADFTQPLSGNQIKFAYELPNYVFTILITEQITLD